MKGVLLAAAVAVILGVLVGLPVLFLAGGKLAGTMSAFVSAFTFPFAKSLLARA